MSNVTTSLMRIFYNQSTPGKSINERVEETASFLFNFKHGWYARDGTGYKEFKELFVTHFFLREIGFETIELFRLKLMGLLNEKMPMYRQIYESTLLHYDPFITFEEKGNSIENARNLVERKGKESFLSEGKSESDLNSTIQSKGSTEQKDSTVSGEESKNEVDRKNVASTESTTTASGERAEKNVGSGNNSRSGTMVETSSKTGSNVENSQSLHSNNPQVTIGTSDYADSLERGLSDNQISENAHAEKQTTESGTSTDTRDITGSESSETKNNATVNEAGSEKVDFVKNTKTESDNVSTSHSDSSSNARNSTTQKSGSEKQNALTESAESGKEGNVYRTGFNGDRQSLLIKYRETFLNINEMLLKECEVLFIGIYRSGYENITGTEAEYYGLWI